MNLWLIIEDSPARAESFIRAIHVKDSNAKIIWIYANASPSDYALNLWNKYKNLKINSCKTLQELCEALTEILKSINEFIILYENLIILLDINLLGVNTKDLSDPQNQELTKILKEFIGLQNNPSFMGVTTGSKNPRNQLLALDISRDDIRGFSDNSWEFDKVDDTTVSDNIVYFEIFVETALSRISIWKNDYLDSLAFSTKKWFQNDDISSYREGVLPHNFSSTINLPLEEKKEQHKKIVKSVFTWFPDSWWSTEESIQTLHENLKCLCGNSTYWMIEEEVRDAHNLSVGAVYILLIASLEYQFEGLIANNNFCNVIENFEELSDSTTEWLGGQNRINAKKSISSLFNLFVALGKDDETGECSIVDIIFDPPGDRIRVTLSWSAQSFSGKVTNLLSAEKVSLPLSAEGKTLRSLMDFLICSQINNEGFGQPGYLYLEGKELIIGV